MRGGEEEGDRKHSAHALPLAITPRVCAKTRRTRASEGRASWLWRRQSGWAGLLGWGGWPASRAAPSAPCVLQNPRPTGGRGLPGGWCASGLRRLAATPAAPIWAGREEGGSASLGLRLPVKRGEELPAPPLLRGGTCCGRPAWRAGRLAGRCWPPRRPVPCASSGEERRHPPRQHPGGGGGGGAGGGSRIRAARSRVLTGAAAEPWSCPRRWHRRLDAEGTAAPAPGGSSSSSTFLPAPAAGPLESRPDDERRDQARSPTSGCCCCRSSSSCSCRRCPGCAEPCRGGEPGQRAGLPPPPPSPFGVSPPCLHPRIPPRRPRSGQEEVARARPWQPWRSSRRSPRPASAP